MVRRKKDIRVYCSNEEAQSIAIQASQVGLSVSNFMRRVALGFSVPSREDAQAIVDLRKVNADRARLGSLLKMAIGTGDKETIESLLQQLAEEQVKLKTILKRIIEMNSDK